MSDAVQQAASATAEPKDFSEYQSLKISKTSEPSDKTQSPTEEKPAPASEPADSQQEPKPELTDEEKAERKRRNDERRERRWYEERGEMRANMRRLETEVERLRAGASPTTPRIEGKPTLQTYLESGKFKTYEEAHEAFTDALTDWKVAQKEQEQNIRKERQTAEEARRSFQKDMDAFSKQHDDYSDVHDAVAERLDSEGGAGNPLTAAILKSKNAASLIYHLGTNGELLDELSDFVNYGDYEGALIRLGEIKASIVKAPAKEKEPVLSTPKTPKTLPGKGSGVMSRNEQLRHAADSNDFLKFREANRKTSA